MKKISLFLLFAIYIASFNAQTVINNNLAQPQRISIPAPLSQNILPAVPANRTCYTVENEARLRAKYPQLETVNNFETWIQQKLQQHQMMKGSGPANYSIPTIVHIIHDGGVSNISQAQVNSQFDVLNEDYRRANSDTTSAVAVAFQSVSGDSRIEFTKALIDPLGTTLAEPGIHRVLYSSLSGLGAPPYTASSADIENIIKPNTSWDPTKYFNLWVLEMGGGILGYAQFPSSSGLSGLNGNGGTSNTDGVVIGYNYFGRTGAVSSPYHLGRTATHEVGHWLGLRHIGGDQNGGCGDDFCNDTPTQKGGTNSNGSGNGFGQNYGCPSHPLTYSGECSGTTAEMFNNYMDYTNDNCMNMFTQDQIARFQTVLANSPDRVELLTSNVSNPNSAPNCSFTANVTTVTEGNSVTFSSTASGATSWSWSFPGGTPSTSTLQNPTVAYVSGVGSPFDVTLTATNAFGSCNLTTPGYITVVPSSGCDTLNYAPPGTLTLYTSAGDWAFGWNATSQHKSTAEYFSAAAHAPYTDVTGGIYYIYAAKDASNGATVDFNVWDATGTAGAPGSILGTTTIPLSTLNGANGLIEILYPSPINVGANAFYFGITMNGFGVGDSLGIVSNTAGDVTPGTAWTQLSSSTWESANSTYGIDLSQFMSPYMTDAAPTAIPTANNTTICEGASINFDGSTSVNATGYNWVFPSGTPNSSTTATQTVTYSSAGNYMAYLVVDGACQAQAIDSISITVNAAQVASFTYSATSYCANQTDPIPTITGTTGGNFSASPTTGLVINTNTGVIDLSASTAGSYTITYFTPGPNCIASAIASVTINALPTVVANATSASICSGDPVTLTGSGATSYTWNNGVSNGNAFNPAATDTYTVTGTDANNCSNTDQITIVVSTCGIPPVANFNSSSSTICLNDCISFNDLSTSAPTSWKWYFFGAATTTSTLQSPTSICYNSTGTFNVALVVTNAFGQDSLFKSNFITVSTPTTPTFTQVAAICSGSTLSALPTTSNNGINGTWSPAINNLVTTPYSFTPTAGQCATTATMTINVNALPTVVVNATSTSICTGDPVTLTGSGATSYTWNNGVSNGNAFNPVATDTYTVTGTDANNCSNTDQITVTVNTSTTPTFTQVAAICSGSTLSALPTTSNNGINGTWSPAINNLVTTPYSFTPTAGQCATTATMTINVNSVDNSTSSTGSTITANTSTATYKWIACDNGNAYIAGETNQSFTPTASGIYAVEVSENGCIDTSACNNIIITGVNQLSANEFNIYPNPANSFVIVELGNKTVEKITLSDIQGQVIYFKTNIKETKLKIDLETVSKGIYFLQIKNEKDIKTYKVVKQ